jgi:hypothetical protein
MLILILSNLKIVAYVDEANAVVKYGITDADIAKFIDVVVE